MAAAEVTRDEFGGYCCKKWTGNEESEEKGLVLADDLNICQLLDLDID